MEEFTITLTAHEINIILYWYRVADGEIATDHREDRNVYETLGALVGD